MDGSSLFQPNTAGLAQLRGALEAANRRTLAAARDTLRVWGEEFRRRLAEGSPRGCGELAASWELVTEEADNGIRVSVGTNLRGKDGRPYPLFLELGTAVIAGGRVAAWRPGDPPVVDWPAKASAERRQAGAAGEPTQMPLVRPIGYEIARRVTEELKTAIAGAMAEQLDGARF